CGAAAAHGHWQAAQDAVAQGLCRVRAEVSKSHRILAWWLPIAEPCGIPLLDTPASEPAEKCPLRSDGLSALAPGLRRSLLSQPEM
nr:hypothetical protein [Tanacetum cinerariifolium]